MPGTRSAEPRPPPVSRLAALLAVAALALAALPLPTEAARITAAPVLPFPVLGTSAVWTGSEAYIFGGRSNTSYQASILRFNPASGAVVTLPTTLPPGSQATSVGRQSTSAVWAGEVAYVFGGAEIIKHHDPVYGPIDVPNALDEIIRFDPRTGVAEKLSSKLPAAAWGTSAVWDAGEKAAYIFGGFSFHYPTLTFDRKDWVVKFKPGADDITEARVVDLSKTAVPRKLSSPTQDSATAIVGNHAYIFGGLASWCRTKDNKGSVPCSDPQANASASSPAASNQVHRFNLVTEEISLLSARLPAGLQWHSAVAAGGDVYLLGGKFANNTASGEILRYYVAQSHAAPLPLTLPSGRFAMSGVSDGETLWLFGGRDANQNIGGLREVLTVQTGATEPTAPRSPTSRCEIAGVRVSWSAPLYDGGAAVDRYRLQRVDADGVPTNLPDVTGTTHVDTTAPAGKKFTYRIFSVNQAGASRSPAEVETVPCFRPPTEPRAFEAYPGDGSAHLRWQPPADLGGSASVQYRVYLNGSATPVHSGPETRLTHPSLANGVPYSYRVTAFAGLHEGPATPARTVTPSDALPGPPSSVDVTLVSGKDRFEVSWNGDPLATGYVVRVGETVSTLRDAVTVPLSGCSPRCQATVTGIKPGQRYWLDVQSTADGNVRSPPSELKTAAYIVAPGDLTGLVAMPGPGYVRLQWEAPAHSGGAEAVYFRIIRNSTGKGETMVNEAHLHATTAWVDRSVQPGVQYTYRVVPYVLAGGAALDGRGAEAAGKAPDAPNQKPVAALVASAIRIQPLAEVTFDGSYSRDPDPEGGVVEYYFDTGEKQQGKPVTSGWIRQPTFTHKYFTAGAYAASLLVRDDRGESSERAALVQICVGDSACRTVGGDPGEVGNGTGDRTPLRTGTDDPPRTGFLGLPGPGALLLLAAAAGAALLTGHAARRRDP